MKTQAVSKFTKKVHPFPRQAEVSPPFDPFMPVKDPDIKRVELSSYDASLHAAKAYPDFFESV